MDKSIEFGAFINGLCKAKKYFLGFVLDKFGVDISVLSKIENGDRHPQSYLFNVTNWHSGGNVSVVHFTIIRYGGYT